MEPREDLKLRFEDWLKRVKEKWKGLYDYSKAGFVNMRSPVTIHCNKHNLDFNQVARTHLTNSGCPKCYTENYSSNTEEFIEKAKQVHGDRYDYSKVDYKHSTKPVTIICKVHGEFEQRPRNHLTGQNCPYCTGNKTAAKANAPHNEALADKIMNLIKRYYPNEAGTITVKHCTGNDDPATLICSKHGEFTVTPHTISRGRTVCVCKKCARNSDKYREEFIEKSKKIHGVTIDYSKLDMNDHKVKLRCKIHDEWFEQEKRNHLKYSGCKKCILEKQSLTQEQFIAKSKECHGDKYDYSKVKYVNNATNVTVICPEHGEFEIIPFDHMRGRGCSLCTSSKGSQAVDKLFKDLGINFIREFSFKEYKYRYDFYIPDVDLLVEIDGVLHFIPGFGEKILAQTQANDKIKNELAYINAKPLIRVKYTTPNAIKSMLEELARKLGGYIAYIRDGKCYSNFSKYCKAYDLPGTTTPVDCKEYSFKVQVARLLDD